MLITNGIGNGYRNIIFKLIRNAGTRANGEADWPDPLEVTLGTSGPGSTPRARGETRWPDVRADHDLTADAAAGPG